MIDPVTTRTWGFRALYTALVLFLVFVRLLPLGMGAGHLPGPDLIVALTFAWVLRRPAYVPAPLIAALFLFLDLMLQRPPGLGAAVVVASAEFLRSRRALTRAQPFAVEWALMTVVFLAMVGLEQVLYAFAMLERPPLGLALLRGLFTAVAYPLIVGLTHYIIGVRRIDAAEANALGERQ
ncbi:rod shape-determining protein MreD [Tropicimonas sp.]|uniref:rod shape-determining protein MreD n=1 Tax=Tropicimonas sp. TaxID=2067044 RepID=UPI003A8888FC